MDRMSLRGDVAGLAAVPKYDLTLLAQIAHAMRQEISDPRLPIYARTNYAEMIQAVDILVDGAGEVEE